MPNELFLPVLKDGKYGFIDRDKNLIIKPKYKYVSDRFRDGYCVITYIKKIRKSVKWVFGYIDIYGNTSIMLHLESATEFNEGMSKIKINNKYGYIDTSLREVIRPKYDCAANFRQGLAGIKLNKRWGFINKTGKIVIDPTYTYVNQFFEDRALVELKNKYGYIDKNGDMIISPEFDIATDFSEGLAYVSEDGEKYG